MQLLRNAGGNDAQEGEERQTKARSSSTGLSAMRARSHSRAQNIWAPAMIVWAWCRRIHSVRGCRVGTRRGKGREASEMSEITFSLGFAPVACGRQPQSGRERRGRRETLCV